MTKSNSSKHLLISIPTYNERGNVERLSAELRLVTPQAHILFIDDSSPDGTGQLLDELAAKDSHIKVIHRPLKSGLGTAHKRAFSYAQQEGYDYLITMDADFLHDPRYIPYMIERAQDADIVIGSRYADGGTYSGINGLRKRLTYFWRFMIKKMLGLACDATGSFRLYRVSILVPAVYQNITSTAFEFNMEALYYFRKAGAGIIEIPIKAHGRTYGKSKLTSKDMYQVLRKFLTLSWDHIKHA